MARTRPAADWIVAAGASASDFALARYNADGSPNVSFSTVVPGYTDNGINNYDFALARYSGGNDDVAPRVAAHTLQGTTPPWPQPAMPGSRPAVAPYIAQNLLERVWLHPHAAVEGIVEDTDGVEEQGDEYS